MKLLIASLAFVSSVFGAAIDCQYYVTIAECQGDRFCYEDPNAGGCRANCTLVTTYRGMPGVCTELPGCIYDDSDVCGPDADDCNYEGGVTCKFGDFTASPTAMTTGPSPAPTTASPTTASPTEPNETPSPTTTSSPTASPTAMTPTTGLPTEATTGVPTSRSDTGGGRCKSDGSIQEQVFGPQTYSCGDYNLGQPEERCLWIDASSSCQGTNFYDCGQTEDQAWPTFQSALDSLNGETVVLIVKAGVYSGEGNVNITSPNIHNLNEYVYLNIFSESGSDDTVIDCKGEGFGFHLFQTTIRLDGFTVINCIAPTRPTFTLPSYAQNKYIQSAPSTGRLGGAFFLDRVFITMNDMIIVNNQAEYGGGIFQYQNSIRMNNSIVEYNCATNSGGGIFLLFANIYMWNSYVICNNADVFGGGIFGHQQRTDVKLNAVVDDNTAEYADEIFCDQTTVNVETSNNGFVADNNVDSWGLNEVTYCCCNNCAFYNLDRSLDFCSRSDNSLIDSSKLLTLAIDQGTCETNDIKTESPTSASGGTPSPTTKYPTATGETFAPTITRVQTSAANGYKVFGVTAIVAMVISFF